MDWHALVGNEKKQEVTVVFHIPIPSVNNAVGMNYRTVLTKAEPFTSSIVPDHVTNFASEAALLQSGALYEYQEVVRYNANLSDAQKTALIDARYTALVSIIQSKIQNQYIYWGFSHDAS
jgi:hypothetical protein